jgi:hypothetical protein
VDVGVDEARHRAEAATVDDPVHPIVAEPPAYVLVRTDVSDAGPLDEDGRIGVHRVHGVHGQGEPQMLDQRSLWWLMDGMGHGRLPVDVLAIESRGMG